MDTDAGDGRFVAKRGLLARLHALPVLNLSPAATKSDAAAVVTVCPNIRPKALVAHFANFPGCHPTPCEALPSEKPVSEANLNRTVALHQLTLFYRLLP